mmetsp:Transcript_65476/g.188698  ORF Transcript_65476/g.188698 Transcript_65476/m.188698 type:complete len:235 (-) Transcript_65476:479-1183(-)
MHVVQARKDPGGALVGLLLCETMAALNEAPKVATAVPLHEENVAGAAYWSSLPVLRLRRLDENSHEVHDIGMPLRCRKRQHLALEELPLTLLLFRGRRMQHLCDKFLLRLRSCRRRREGTENAAHLRVVPRGPAGAQVGPVHRGEASCTQGLLRDLVRLPQVSSDSSSLAHGLQNRLQLRPGITLAGKHPSLRPYGDRTAFLAQQLTSLAASPVRADEVNAEATATLLVDFGIH